MDDRLLIVRETPLRDLIGLARDAADALRHDDTTCSLAKALDGVTSEVATDACEPARLTRDISHV